MPGFLHRGLGILLKERCVFASSKLAPPIAFRLEC